MSRRLILVLALAAVAVLLGLCQCGHLAGLLPTGSAEVENLGSIRLPEGFTIELWATVEGARSLTQGPPGVVFAGSRGAGKVHAIVDEDLDGQVDEVLVIAEGLNQPNGVAWRDGDLYVAEIARVLRFPGVAKRLFDPPEPEVVRDDFPGDEHHGWKFMAFGPDGLLYVPVGAPCNVCDAGLPYAAIHRMRPDGSERELVARGVRNTVGFDWHPATGMLWFTDNGRDWMGDEGPSDELNRVSESGQHFGFPFCHGRSSPDPDFTGRDCAEFTPPVLELGPHVAALGMRFCSSTAFPERYRNGIFIAEHGSWNRTKPIGYRVTFVPLDDRGDPAGYETFAAGWLDGPAAWGRPVDVLFLLDGSMLVSDDKGNAVYRIRYGSK